MIAQHTSSRRPDISEKSSFWVTALLGVPVANVALLSFVAFLAAELFLPVAALVALGELALLISWARTYGIGVLGALAAMLGVAVITVLGLAVVFLGTISSACEPGCLS